MHFPVYRKYPNNLSFFRIDSATNFVELKITGSKYSLTEFNAKIHPDRVFIDDMIKLHGGYWTESSEKEFENALENCRNSRKLIL